MALQQSGFQSVELLNDIGRRLKLFINCLCLLGFLYNFPTDSYCLDVFQSPALHSFRKHQCPRCPFRNVYCHWATLLLTQSETLRGN